MSKVDKFEFMREATEPLLVVDFETRKLLAVSDSLTILFGSSSNNLVNSQLDSIIAVPGKGVDLGSFFEIVEKSGLAKLDKVTLKSEKIPSTYLELCASMLSGENKKLVRIWVYDVTAREKTAVAYQKSELQRNRAEQLGQFGHWERNL